MQTDPAPIALTPKEMAAALRISEKSLWSLTKAGTLPSVKLGRLVRYPVPLVAAALERMAAPAGEGAD